MGVQAKAFSSTQTWYSSHSLTRKTISQEGFIIERLPTKDGYWTTTKDRAVAALDSNTQKRKWRRLYRESHFVALQAKSTLSFLPSCLWGSPLTDPTGASGEREAVDAAHKISLCGGEGWQAQLEGINGRYSAPGFKSLLPTGRVIFNVSHESSIYKTECFGK